MTRYNTRMGQEPKGRSPYASLEECEIQGGRRRAQLANTCRRMDPSRFGAVGELPKMHTERGGDANKTLAFPVSPLELNTDRGGRISR